MGTVEFIRVITPLAVFSTANPWIKSTSTPSLSRFMSVRRSLTVP